MNNNNQNGFLFQKLLNMFGLGQPQNGQQNGQQQTPQSLMQMLGTGFQNQNVGSPMNDLFSNLQQLFGPQNVQSSTPSPGTGGLYNDGSGGLYNPSAGGTGGLYTAPDVPTPTPRPAGLGSTMSSGASAISPTNAPVPTPRPDAFGPDMNNFFQNQQMPQQQQTTMLDTNAVPIPSPATQMDANGIMMPSGPGAALNLASKPDTLSMFAKLLAGL
jgi:hypothetical protein